MRLLISTAIMEIMLLQCFVVTFAVFSVLCVCSQAAAIPDADNDAIQLIEKRSILGDIPPWMKLSFNMRPDAPEALESDSAALIVSAGDDAPAQQPTVALTPYIRPRNQCFFHTVSCFGRRPSRLFPRHLATAGNKR